MSIYLWADTETGGFDPSKHSLLELAIVVVNMETMTTLVEPFSFLVQPYLAVSPDAAKVHGITEEQARAEGLTVDAAVNLLYGVVKATNPVAIAGHNIKFDVGFINALVARATGLAPEIFMGGWLPKKQVCTLEAAKKFRQRGLLRIGGLKLGELANHFGVSLEGAHRAQNDIVANIEVYKGLQKVGGDFGKPYL